MHHEPRGSVRDYQKVLGDLGKGTNINAKYEIEEKPYNDNGCEASGDLGGSQRLNEEQ
jgi:hypothetical protein